MRFKTLDRFILKAFLGPLLMTFFVIMFILIMQFLWLYVDDIIGKGLKWRTIFELLLYASSNLLAMALPLSCLLASIMTFGQLGEHNELLAIKTSGVSLGRMMLPIAMLIGSISIGTYFFVNNVLPVTNLKLTALLYSIKTQQPEMQLQEGIFFDGINNYTIKVDKKDTKTGLLQGLLIYDHSAGLGNTSVTVADSGYIEITADKQFMVFTMMSGFTYEETESRYKNPKQPFRRNSFKKQTVTINLSGLGFERTDENLFKSNSQMLNQKQLKVVADSTDKALKTRTDYITRNYILPTSFRNTAELDTLPHPARKKILTAQSILDKATPEEKMEYYERALQMAQATKSTVQSQLSDSAFSVNLINQYEVQYHVKFTIALACLLFFFIGAPLGAIIRKGGFGAPVVVSLVVFLVYYVSSLIGQKMGGEGIIFAPLAAWLSTLLILPFSLFFTYAAIKDAPILNNNKLGTAIQNLYKWVKGWTSRFRKKEAS